MENVGQRLKTLRLSKSLKLSEVAQKAFSNKRMASKVNALERGAINATMAITSKILEALGNTWAELEAAQPYEESTNPDTTLIRTVDAARVYGFPYKKILRLVEEDKVEWTKDGRDTFIFRESLEAYFESMKGKETKVTLAKEVKQALYE